MIQSVLAGTLAGFACVTLWLVVAYADASSEAQTRRERMQRMCEPPGQAEILVQTVDGDGAPRCRYYPGVRRPG